MARLSSQFTNETMFGAGYGGGVKELIFGLIFIGAGTPIILIGADVLHVPDNEAPPFVLLSVGAVFAGAGLMIAGGGVAGLLRKARRRRLLAQHPDEPWNADYPWTPQGTADTGGSEAVVGAAFTVFLAVFLVPFNYVGLRPVGWWSAVIGLFDLVLAFSAVRLVYLVMRRAKYGRSRLKFLRFPFFLGEQFDVLLSAAVSGRATLDCLLECRENYTVVVPSSDGNRTEIRSRQLYSQQLAVDCGSELEALELPISMLLPLDGRPTDVAIDQPVYWQLIVTADVPGIDYRARFLLPIYRRPGQAAPVAAAPTASAPSAAAHHTTAQ